MKAFAEKQFSECYAHYYPKVEAYIAFRVRGRADAEDLAQDVFELLWKHWEQVRVETLHNFIYTIMRNVLVDYVRRRALRQGILVSLRDDVLPERGCNTVERDCSFRELGAAHRMAAGRLPERRRQVYYLYFYDGLSYASIARRLSVSERTVGCHLWAACKSVRADLCGMYRPEAV